METQLLRMADISSHKAITEKMIIRSGDVFNIKLRENPISGYGWDLARLPSHLHLLSINYTIDPYRPGTANVGGIKTFTFRAIGKSIPEDNLVFLEMRPWEKTAFAKQIWEIEVQYKINYEPITDYFVAHVKEGHQYLVIRSKTEFDQCFQPAAILRRKQRWITEEDFKNHYIVAKVEPDEEMATEYILKDIDIVNEILEIKYKVKKEKIAWTGRWCCILLVEKQSYQNIAFIENWIEKAKINV